MIGDLPDPATVSQSTGLIRYELGLIQTYSASTGTIGTVLMQMIATRGIKVEIFPGKAAGQVAGSIPTP